MKININNVSLYSTPRAPKLSEQAVKEFQSNYFKEYNVKLSYQEAEMKAFKLLLLFREIYFPIKEI